MKPNLTGIDPKVSGIDLNALKAKLAEEKGWSDADLDNLELQYKRFLTMKLKRPEMDLVPTKFIDEMWHAHILDTMAYAGDCQAAFGYFLHHFPYLGVGGEQEKAKLDHAFDETCTAWQEAFGDEYRQLPLPRREKGIAFLPDGDILLVGPGRCAGHSCHAPSSCACRSPGACK